MQGSRTSNVRGVRSDARTCAGGFTLIEVLVAAAILAIAALAALELLSRSDAASLYSRRLALATVEAERILAESAELVKEQRAAAKRETLDSSIAAEALNGCTAVVREFRENMSVTDRSGAVMRVPVIRLTAEIADPDGNALVSLERVVPTAAAEDAP